MGGKYSCLENREKHVHIDITDHFQQERVLENMNISPKTIGKDSDISVRKKTFKKPEEKEKRKENSSSALGKNWKPKKGNVDADKSTNFAESNHKKDFKFQGIEETENNSKHSAVEIRWPGASLVGQSKNLKVEIPKNKIHNRVLTEENLVNKSFNGNLGNLDKMCNFSPIHTMNTNANNKSYNTEAKELCSQLQKGRKKFDVKLIKKERPVEKKQVWKDYDIKTLVKEERLKDENRDVMIFKGELSKYFLSLKTKSYLNCSEKWCILTKREMIVYNSKESFLKLQKPSLSISISDVVEYGRFDPSKEKLKSLKSQHYFYVKVHDEFSKTEKEKPKLERDQRLSPLPILPSLEFELNKIKAKSPIMSRNNRISLINDISRNQTGMIATKKDHIRNNTPIPSYAGDGKHIFSSADEDQVNKWVFLIDYLKHSVKLNIN